MVILNGSSYTALGVNVCFLKQDQINGGKKDFSENIGRAYFAETFPTVSCVTVGSSVCARLPCKIAFFQSLGIAAKRPP